MYPFVFGFKTGVIFSHFRVLSLILFLVVITNLTIERLDIVWYITFVSFSGTFIVTLLGVHYYPFQMLLL